MIQPNAEMYMAVSTISTNGVKIYRKGFTIPVMSAGENGYLQVSDVGFNGDAISVLVRTGQIAQTGGLQLTPIYSSNGTVFFQYYAPSGIELATQATVIVIC